MILIDIHSHILPGLDDGAMDLEETLSMAKAACEDGIIKLVATPHVIKGVFENRKEDILKQVLNINYYLKHSGVKLQVLPGAEYALDPKLAQSLAAGELLTINNSGRYLLVELPQTMVPDYCEELLHEIQLYGVTPIIAHPERNQALAKKPGILEAWAKRGISAQVTSTSITGGFGPETKKKALQYVAAGLAQVVASDGHDARDRAPVMYQAYREIERLWGTDLARILTIVNPDRIITGRPLQAVVPKTAEPDWSKYLGKFRHVSKAILKL